MLRRGCRLGHVNVVPHDLYTRLHNLRTDQLDIGGVSKENHLTKLVNPACNGASIGQSLHHVVVHTSV